MRNTMAAELGTEAAHREVARLTHSKEDVDREGQGLHVHVRKVAGLLRAGPCLWPALLQARLSCVPG